MNFRLNLVSFTRVKIIIDVGSGGTGGICPHSLKIIKQSAPLQLKMLPVFVYEGAPKYMYPHILNASCVPENYS